MLILLYDLMHFLHLYIVLNVLTMYCNILFGCQLKFILSLSYLNLICFLSLINVLVKAHQNNYIQSTT